MLNRSVGKMHLFGKDADFEAFQRVMIEAHQRHPIRIRSYCVLSNHWHFAVWPFSSRDTIPNSEKLGIVSPELPQAPQSPRRSDPTSPLGCRNQIMMSNSRRSSLARRAGRYPH